MKISSKPAHQTLAKLLTQQQLWTVGFESCEEAVSAAENNEVVCMRFSLDYLHDLCEGLTLETASFERWYSAEVLDSEFSMIDLTNEDEWMQTFEWSEVEIDGQTLPEIITAEVVGTGPRSMMAALESDNEFENFNDWMKFANENSFDAGIAALCLGITDAEAASNRYLGEYNDDSTDLLKKILEYVGDTSEDTFWNEARECVHLLDAEQCIYELKDEGHVEEDNGHWFRAY